MKSADQQSSSSTFVCIYTFEESQNTRYLNWINDLPAEQFTWAKTVQIGAGNQSRLKGNILELGVENGYHLLPQKTLELLRFFYYETNFEHLIKVDDDVQFADLQTSMNKLLAYDYCGNWIDFWHFKHFAYLEEKGDLLKNTLQFDIIHYAGAVWAEGPLYHLSRKAVGAVLDFYEEHGLPNSLQIEDIMVGLAVEHQRKAFGITLPETYKFRRLEYGDIVCRIEGTPYKYVGKFVNKGLPGFKLKLRILQRTVIRKIRVFLQPTLFKLLLLLGRSSRIRAGRII